MKIVIDILFELIFTVIFWFMLIAVATLWPVIFLYIKFSGKSVCDFTTTIAESVISLDKILDAIRRNN